MHGDVPCHPFSFRTCPCNDSTAAKALRCHRCPERPMAWERRNSGGPDQVHHHRKRSQVRVGDGAGGGAEVAGAVVGGAAVGRVGGGAVGAVTGEPGAVVAEGGGSVVPVAEGEAESLAPAAGDPLAEAVAPEVAETLVTWGGAVVRPEGLEPSPSSAEVSLTVAVPPPVKGSGASVPSSAKPRPPAASTRPAARRTVRRRRRR
ncbi:protein of unknown function [Streptomyces murinus]